jgi:hypothetical protein
MRWRRLRLAVIVLLDGEGGAALSVVVVVVGGSLGHESALTAVDATLPHGVIAYTGRSDTDPAITGESSEERCSRTLTRPERGRPVTAGAERLSSRRIRMLSKRGGTAAGQRPVVLAGRECSIHRPHRPETP